MIHQKPVKANAMTFMVARIKDYMQLVKPNLSFLVVFSSVTGYLLAPGVRFSWEVVILLFLGGFFVTGASNTINQILEQESDRLMRRTAARPMPENRMSRTEAWLFAIIMGIAGVGILSYFFNPLAGFLSFISMVLYAFAYTPMKKINSVAVLIGAIPGALPPLIGWVAATNTLAIDTKLGYGGWVLFIMQFFWQFPHLWAIAWVGYDDYQKAGIKMLPSHLGRTRFTGLQCMFYSIVLIPIALFPRMIGMTGDIGMYICMACGLFYFLASLNFYIKNNHDSAKKLMYASFIYLPVILIALLADKLPS